MADAGEDISTDSPSSSTLVETERLVFGQIGKVGHRTGPDIRSGGLSESIRNVPWTRLMDAESSETLDFRMISQCLDHCAWSGRSGRI